MSRIRASARVVMLKPYAGTIVNAQAGDTILPHMFDCFFDGTDDYLVVGLQPDNSGTPFTVYGWSGITIVGWIKPICPKPNTFYSKTGMIGDVWTDRPSTHLEAEARTDYSYLNVLFVARNPDGTPAFYGYNIYGCINQMVQVVRRFDLSSREYSVWVNGEKKYAVNIPADQKTILEWNPDTATHPVRYKRFVLGANTLFDEHLTVMERGLLIYRYALTDSEIVQTANGVVNASELMLFLDTTFFDGSKYIDLSGNNNHGYPYNGVARVPTSNPWVYRVVGLYSGSDVKILVPPRTYVRVNGVWYTNDSSSNIMEIYAQPGRLELYFEGMDYI